MGKFPFFSIANISSRFMTNKKGICLNIKLLKIVTHRNAVGRWALDWVHGEWLMRILISSYDKWLASERGPLTKGNIPILVSIVCLTRTIITFLSLGAVVDGGRIINQSFSKKRMKKTSRLSRRTEATLLLSLNLFIKISFTRRPRCS